jgi:hypothetical protein
MALACRSVPLSISGPQRWSHFDLSHLPCNLDDVMPGDANVGELTV